MIREIFSIVFTLLSHWRVWVAFVQRVNINNIFCPLTTSKSSLHFRTTGLVAIYHQMYVSMLFASGIVLSGVFESSEDIVSGPGRSITLIFHAIMRNWISSNVLRGCVLNVMITCRSW